MAWRIEIRTSKGSPRRMSAGTVMRESAMVRGSSALVETARDRDQHFRSSRVKHPIAHDRDGDDVLRTRETNARINFNLCGRRWKFEHGHFGNGIHLGKQVDR